MRRFFPNRSSLWAIGLVLILLALAAPIYIFWPRSAPAEDAWAYVPLKKTPTEHTDIVRGPFETPQEVTRACLACHPGSAAQVMATTHWTWESEPFDVPWRDEPVTIGKKTQINNFCIGAQGNERRCMSCHAGYGWSDPSFDFQNQENVDCLACHADMGLYAKGEYGNPAEGVDLLAAARSVRSPTRENCGACHFNGGGGNNVKHGDLDESLYFPNENRDVHMGQYEMECVDCHRGDDHQILGRLLVDNYQIDPAEQVHCTDCHQGSLHQDERLNLHTTAVACQTCHIPEMAVKDPTKLFWDWSEAGQDVPEDHFTYLKIKGTFVYEENVEPQYLWYNGNNTYRYILGDPVNPDGPTMINHPAGNINDFKALIFPFKIHVAIQPYDTIYQTLLQPRTAGGGRGGGGYWEVFDWASALALGASDTGIQFSGEYGFTETWMYWPTTHMVQAKEKALQCVSCHSPDGRLDWEALGYPGDPIRWGGRNAAP
jgi:octaheme c-type cytochrome (tetrathionate reductase family)